MMESDRQDSAGGGDAHAGREAEGDRRLAGLSRPAVTAAPKDLLSVAAFAAAYFLAHWLAFLFPDSHQILMAVWPPGGIGLASLLLTRRRVWPLLLPCLFIAGMLADVLSGRPLLPSLGYMTANIAESLGCAALIVKFCGTAVRFSRSRDVLTLAAAATLVNGCTALGGAGAAMLGSHAPFWREYRTWWTSDGLGILLVAPLIVSWAGAWRGPSRRWGQWAEFLMFLATWCCLAQMAFAPGADERSFYPLPYVMIAVLAWPCLRFGQRGNTLALALLAVIALAGRPALPASATEDRLLSIQMFLGFIGMSGLFLAASVSERKRSEASLQVSERAYADLYEDAPSACLSVDLSSKKIVKCNRMLEGLVGYSREEIVGRRFTDVIAPESLGDADRLHEELRSRGRVDGGEVTIIRKDGALRNIVIDATAIRGEEGTPLRSRSVWQDITDRKRSEASLRETAAELEAAQRIAHVGSWSWDVRTDEARWTEETFRIFGLPLGHLGQHETNFVQMVHPEDQARVHRALTEALDGAARYDLDYRILRPDGGERAIHANAEVVRDEAGRPAFLRGTVHDITEYKRVQEALQESAQFNEQVIGNVRDGVVVYGADLRYRAWNPAMERITGVAAADVLGRYPVDVFPFPNQFGMVDALREVLDKGTVRAVEVPFQRSDGRHGWISDVSGPLRKKTGEIFGVIAVVRDITERKHAERRQSVVAAMFRAFLTEKGDDAFDSALRAVLEDFASDFGVFGIIDENGDLVCPSVTRHVGELCRMPEKTIVFPRSAWGDTIWGAALRTGVAAFSNEPFQVPSGHLPIGNCLTAPIVTGRGSIGLLAVANKPGGYSDEDRALLASIARGVAPVLQARLELKLAEGERARAQEQLAQAQKMESVGRLAGGVAHDFNNLLTVINGYSKLILSGLRAEDPLREQMEEIYLAGGRAAGLTRQLLAFSRKQILQPRRLDLNEVVSGMEKLLGRLVSEDVELRCSLSPDRPIVHADPHQLEQVIMNLAVNARDAMPRGGRLTIETGLVERAEGGVDAGSGIPAGRCAVLTVSDTGIGMDEATRLRIFEPFFTTKGVGGGTGLGLSMVQGIVTQSGGGIDVRSEPGQGTAFRIFLPAIVEGIAEAEEPAAAHSLRGQESILLVEDQREVRRFATAVLKSCGYRVTEAANAAEALTICEADQMPVDLVLTDVVMPHTSGAGLVAKLTQFRPGIKALFMSGYSDEIIAPHGVLAEGARLIQKPFTPEELARKVKEALGPAGPPAPTADEDPAELT